MVKVLYISYDGILDPVGESQVIPYMQGLAKKGVEIVLMSFEKIHKMRKTDSYRACESLLFKGDIHWKHFFYHKNPSFPATLFDIINGALNGFFLIKRNSIKIMHARGYIAGIIACLLKILVKAKFIFDMRGFWPEEKVDAGSWTKEGFLFHIMKHIEKRLILSADEVIVLTEKAQDIVMRSYHVQNITVIPCCVDIKTFSKTNTASRNILLPENRPIIIYLGSIGTFYNFKEMAKFFLVFKETMPEAFFLVLSNGSNEIIFKTFKGLNISKNDFSVSHATYSQIPFYLHASAFSIIFYRRELSAAGCCPIKFAESLACGVPVFISPGIGDCDHLLQQERVGVVLKEHSLESYRKAATQMRELLFKKEELAARCYATAKKYFSLEYGTERYSMIYQKLRRRQS